jgi:hypothetical protein
MRILLTLTFPIWIIPGLVVLFLWAIYMFFESCVEELFE